MNRTSFIYKNIFFYRLLMNLLYGGGYRRRFEEVCRRIEGKSVTELCFGDIIIADFCKRNSIAWTGIDVHPGFVKNAAEKGFYAMVGKLESVEKFPAGDTCIIAGSLYHFHKDLESLFVKILACAPTAIISEPVINLSDRKGIIGKLAKGSATINGQRQQFRFTERSLTMLMEVLSKKLNFNYTITGRFNKDLIIIVHR